MNQYKIGDTVWTRKRGKCRVIREVSSPANRPYRIMDQNGCFYYPKASNLYPSEAAMNADQMKREAFDFADWFKLVIDKASKPKPPRPPFASGGIVHDPHLRGSDFMFKPDPIQPKFKVGDAVYYRGLRLIIESIWIGIDNVPVYLIRPNGYACSVQESDLRLWKETVLTHVLEYGSDKWGEWRHGKPAFYKTTYLGVINDHETFRVDTGSCLALFRGIKGDDIDQTK